MHDRGTVEAALKLHEAELNNCEISRRIVCSACDCLGLRWTAAFPSDESKAVSIYVSRKEDVARLEEFVGPKR